ncbi:MAG: electron transfer flavoprotein subunit alpha [Chloroflexota bacterium]|nr:electron transfer flavoprotein subunit alpha [Chloroflexota bacterium]
MTEEKKIKKPRGIALLVVGKCIACGARCQSACSKANAIEMNDQGEPIIDSGKCIGCKKCIKVCPADALEMYFTPEELKILEEIKAQKAASGAVEEEAEEEDDALAQLKDYKGVWVFVEQTEGEVAEVSWELMGAGAELANKLGVELCAVVIGNKVEHLCHEAFAYGATKAYLMDAPIYEHYRTEPYYKANCYLVEKYKPEIVLFGATGLGRDLAGAIATVLATGLTADCTGLDVDEKGSLMQTRPAFGGNIMATIMTERTRPQMSTVRPHVMPLPQKGTAQSGEIILEQMVAREEDFATKVLEIIRDKRGDAVDVAAAEILVSGGRGMCGPENFNVLQELADELDGVVSCSRAVVEAGWLPVERQVGQTGKTVRPKIYIACGISGAIQHLVGMQESDVIIAINRDSKAPIFEVATYGIVGDLFQIVPAITERIRHLRSGGAGDSAAMEALMTSKE